MDQKRFVELLPSVQLKARIAETGFLFRERELIVIAERYARKFAQRQTLLDILTEQCCERQNRDLARALYRQHAQDMESITHRDPGTAYYVEITPDEDSATEHILCASFDAALRAVRKFRTEFEVEFSDASEIRIEKESLFDGTVDFEKQMLGCAWLTEGLEVGSAESYADDGDRIEIWDLYDSESENNVRYPEILKEPCSPVRFPARFGYAYGMQIGRFRCNEYDDAYVIRLDSSSVNSDDLTNFHNAHCHIPIPTLDQIPPEELPEPERANYFRLEAYFKQNGMI